MKALIDGDILPYECGALKKKPPKKGDDDIAPEVKEGDLLPFDFCWGAVQSKIAHMLEATKADDYVVYLSSQNIKTWRYEVASIKDYKGRREDKEKPFYWELIRDNLKLHYKCIEAEFIEADDAMSIEQYADIHRIKTCGHTDDWERYCDTVICTRDKDLDMVPGWHFKWGIGDKKDDHFNQTEIGGLRCFYKQLLTGDNVDNILGLFGVGEKSTAVRRILSYDNEGDMFREVYARYSERFGNYAQKFLVETGQLLWMQQHLKDRWNPWDDGRAQQWLA